MGRSQRYDKRTAMARRSDPVVGLIAIAAAQVEVLPRGGVHVRVDPLPDEQVHGVAGHLFPGDVCHRGCDELLGRGDPRGMRAAHEARPWEDPSRKHCVGTETMKSSTHPVDQGRRFASVLDPNTRAAVCVTPKSFKSCSNCEVEQLHPTTMRPNHEFCCPCAPSAGFRKPC